MKGQISNSNALYERSEFKGESSKFKGQSSKDKVQR